MPTSKISGDKQPEALTAVLKELRKKYGDDFTMSTDDGQSSNVESFPTGCFAIDRLLGCGGLPKGRIIEVFGQESSGKSTLCLFFVSQIQKLGGRCLYIDSENTFDLGYARSIGVDTKKLLVTQPSTLEESMEAVQRIVRTNTIDLIIVDSVAALVPARELNGEEMLKDSMAVQARLMSQALRILSGDIARSKTIVVFINQLREKIDIKWGPKDTTTGGKALKFYASVRLQVTKKEKFSGDGHEVIGNQVHIKAVKNKVGFPFREGTFDLYYGSGIDLYADTFDTGVELGIISKKGNTYEFKDKKIGVGRDQAKNFFRENPKVNDDIRGTILSVLAERWQDSIKGVGVTKSVEGESE